MYDPLSFCLRQASDHGMKQESTYHITSNKISQGETSIVVVNTKVPALVESTVCPEQ